VFCASHGSPREVADYDFEPQFALAAAEANSLTQFIEANESSIPIP